MADLSSLSTEQLEAYKRLLFKKQSTQMEQSGGPGVAKPPLPEGLQEGKTEESHDFYKHPSASNFFIPPEFKEQIPEGVEAIANKRYAPGVSLLSQGAKRTLAPVAVGAMAANPSSIPAAIPAVAASMGLQKGGEYVAGKLGATPEQQEATGEVASWVPIGAMGSSKVRAGAAGATVGAVKGAAEALSSPRSLMRSGAGYFGGRVLGEATGMGATTGEAIGMGAGLVPPIIKGAVKGARDNIQALNPKPPIGPVEAPAPKLKGPTLGTLQDAVKSGHMDMDGFAQNLTKLGYDPETQGLIIKNLQAKISPKSAVVPGETPKTISLGHLKDAVKNDLMSMDEFDSTLQKQGYDEESRGIMKSLLQKQIEAAKSKKVDKIEEE